MTERGASMVPVITCTFEHGSVASLRHTTVDALIVRDGLVLLTKRAMHLPEGGKYCLPGGYLDRGETLFEGVRREVREETGYACDNLQVFRIISNPDRIGDDRQNITVVFLAEVGEQVGEPDDEVTSLGWFRLDELPPDDAIAFDHAATIESYIRLGEAFGSARNTQLPLIE